MFSGSLPPGLCQRLLISLHGVCSSAAKAVLKHSPGHVHSYPKMLLFCGLEGAVLVFARPMH